MKKSHSAVFISLMLITLLPACSKNPPDTAWSEAFTLSTGSNNSKPQIAINSAGRKLAVWQQIEYKEELDTATNTAHAGFSNHGDHTHYIVSARVHVWGANTDSDGKHWLSPSILESGAWTQIRHNSRDNTTNIKISGENFATVKETAPQVAVDSNGNGLALWEMHNATSGVVELSWARFNGSSDSWTVSSTPLDDATADIRNPQLSLSKNGIALAAWEQRDSTAYNWVIYAKTYNTSGWDTTATRLSDLDSDGQALPAEHVRVVYNDVGIGLAVWRQLLKTAGTSNTDAQYAIYAKRFLISGNTWAVTNAVLVSDGDGYDANTPSLSMNSTGDAWASWQQLNDTAGTSITGINSIWTNRFDASGNSWGTATKITKVDIAATSEDESSQNAYDSSIAVNDAGDVLVAWLQSPIPSIADPLNNKWNTQATRVWTAGYNGSWQTSTATTSDSDRYDASAPQVVAISDTTIFVSWREGTTPKDSSSFIAHTRFYTTTIDYGYTESVTGLTTSANGPLASSFAGSKLVMIWDNLNQAIQYSELQ